MNEKQFKVIFVGDLLVGKTSFIIKYTQNKFSPTYKATFGGKSLSLVRNPCNRSIRFCRRCITSNVSL